MTCYDIDITIHHHPSPAAHWAKSAIFVEWVWAALTTTAPLTIIMKLGASIIFCQKHKNIFNSFSFEATEMVITSEWGRIQPEIQIWHIQVTWQCTAVHSKADLRTHIPLIPHRRQLCITLSSWWPYNDNATGVYGEFFNISNESKWISLKWSLALRWKRWRLYPLDLD